MHESAVKVNDVSHNNLCNAHNTIGSCSFVQSVLYSLGIQFTDYISNFDNLNSLNSSFCSSNFHFTFLLSLLQ